jgi:hypothetical protein
LLKTVPVDWRRHSYRVAWKVVVGHGSSPAAIQLHRLLNDYADQVSRRIDASWPGTTAKT